jgi:hypothetical protein
MLVTNSDILGHRRTLSDTRRWFDPKKKWGAQNSSNSG